MGKHDMPSLQFKVEGGRLVPATPYEAEVLDTYQRGAEITVTLHQKRSLPLLRKYWAVLRDVVTNGNTPWQSADEASDALKLALGVTDISKTVKGQWFIRPGSISFTSMDEAAFRDFFEKAMAILAEVTGIDPDELSRRYSHLAEQEPSSVPSPNPADDADSSARVCSVDGCNDPVDAKGYCGAHYQRWRRHGDPTLGRQTRTGEPRQFLEEVVLTYNGDACLTWPYSRDSKGRATIRDGETTAAVHRIVCEMVHGPAPTPQHEAAHSCGKGHEACVNPNHLRWATKEENEADKLIHGTVWRGGSKKKADNTADEADHAEPEAGDTSTPVSGSAEYKDGYSPADCLKAFLRTASDTECIVNERRENLEQMTPWWKDALPNDLDFVRACLQTADKVAKGELQEVAAKKYLEGLLHG